MTIRISSDSLFYALLAAITVVLCTAALFTDGTAGNGDSICHYMMARGSWNNPNLFLDLWGKPVYTFFSSPLAQIGFKTVKVFNILAMSLTCWFCYLTAKKLELKYAAWVAIFLFFSSETIEVTMSAFTEPVFALLLIAGIYLLTCNRFIWASVILSFLPFARQEGLIILTVIIVYLVSVRAFKAIPFLAIGHLVLGLAGLPVYHDIFWTFTQNPYVGKVATDGDRHWNYFLNRMYYLIGPASYALLRFGVLSQAWEFFTRAKEKIKDRIFINKAFLITGVFASILIAHSIFWATGMFASIGLTRVMVTVWPAMAILCVIGLETLLNLVDKLRVKLITNAVAFITLAAVFYCTFLYAPTRIDYQSDFYLNDGQQIQAYQITPYVQKKFPGYHKFLSDVGLTFFLDCNFYDNTGHWINHIAPDFRIKENELIIWDDYFSGGYEAIPKEKLLSLPYLKLDTTFSSVLSNQDTFTFMLFVKQEEPAPLSAQ